MADQKPLVLVAGVVRQIAAGDSIPASALSDATTQATGNNGPKIATTAFVANTLNLGEWTTTGLSISAASGAFSNAVSTGYFHKVGRLVNFSIRMDIISNGSAAGAVRVLLPWLSRRLMVCAGRENTATGAMLQGIVAENSDLLSVFTYSNTYPGGDGRVLIVSGAYEATV